MLGNVCSRVSCVYCKEKRVCGIIIHSIAHGCCCRCLKNAQAHVMIRRRKNYDEILLFHDSNEVIGLACFRMSNVAYARHSVKIYFGMWCLGQNICSRTGVVCVVHTPKNVQLWRMSLCSVPTLVSAFCAMLLITANERLFCWNLHSEHTTRMNQSKQSTMITISFQFQTRNVLTVRSNGPNMAWLFWTKDQMSSVPWILVNDYIQTVSSLASWYIFELKLIQHISSLTFFCKSRALYV